MPPVCDAKASSVGNMPLPPGPPVPAQREQKRVRIKWANLARVGKEGRKARLKNDSQMRRKAKKRSSRRKTENKPGTFFMKVSG